MEVSFCSFCFLFTLTTTERLNLIVTLYANKSIPKLKLNVLLISPTDLNCLLTFVKILCPAVLQNLQSLTEGVDKLPVTSESWPSAFPETRDMLLYRCIRLSDN